MHLLLEKVDFLHRGVDSFWASQGRCGGECIILTGVFIFLLKGLTLIDFFYNNGIHLCSFPRKEGMSIH